ncbi:hypothetical protein SSX86_014768 [Deinandra increscens subsp. villosa]|uniref:Protein TIFY n=1 Tax=Deinandra increscens subsp. villosa TaxID=3103831 RepID=A0AAP0H034_9ASTR
MKSPAERMAIDLLSNIESPDQNKAHIENLTNLKLEDSVKKPSSGKSAAPSEPKTKTAPMTIFYDGRVIVLDDIPDYRARDVLLTVVAGYYPSYNGKAEARVELASTSTDRVEVNGLDPPIASEKSVSSEAEGQSQHKSTVPVAESVGG